MTFRRSLTTLPLISLVLVATWTLTSVSSGDAVTSVVPGTEVTVGSRAPATT